MRARERKCGRQEKRGEERGREEGGSSGEEVGRVGGREGEEGAEPELRRGSPRGRGRGEEAREDNRTYKAGADLGMERGSRAAGWSSRDPRAAAHRVLRLGGASRRSPAAGFSAARRGLGLGTRLPADALLLHDQASRLRPVRPLRQPLSSARSRAAFPRTSGP